MTQIATILVVIGIAGLFFLDYDRKERTSGALWLAILWLAIAGSKPVSAWLNMRPGAEQLAEGSPLDRNVFMVLLAIGVAVLASRGDKVVKFLKANGIILTFLLYCAFSIFWSDYPDVAFKRWIKSLGDFVMILIILTDRDPLLALKKVFSRLGFVLVPLSVLFIKYYPDLGRSYSPYEGTAYYVGVAEDKNMLGKICLVIGLGLCWRFYEEWIGPRRSRILLAVGSTLTMVFYLFWLANSMTSLSCFAFGTFILFGTGLLKAARKRSVVHMMVASVVVVSFAVLFLDMGSAILVAMGRNPTLTGRADLWKELMAMDVNPFVGTGFESFWLGKRLDYLWKLHWWHPTEAHDGYLEVLLNLGWAGIALLGVVVVTGYRNVLNLLQRVPSAGRIRLAFFVVGIAYNYTESSIRTLDPVWFVFLLSMCAVPRSFSMPTVVQHKDWAAVLPTKRFDWKWEAEPAPQLREH